MKAKTGWDAVPKKYRTIDPATNSEPLIPKRVLVSCGLWEETIEGTMLSGATDEQIRECFEEYGCKEAEIAGYFEQYAEPLAMGATAGR